MTVLALYGIGVLLEDGGHETLGPTFQIVGILAFVIWLILSLLTLAARV